MTNTIVSLSALLTTELELRVETEALLGACQQVKSFNDSLVVLIKWKDLKAFEASNLVGTNGDSLM
jgi:hypothetical protein